MLVPVNPFGTPSGIAGQLAGWLMGTLNAPLYEELLPLLDLRPDQRVLEIGYGAGRMIPMMLKTDGVVVAGADPSETMRAMAVRHNRRTADRIDLRLGDAERTGFGAGEFDRVLSVNNVHGWPDVPAGVREMRRVTAPGGRFLVAVHSRQSKARGARRLGLSAERLTELGSLLQDQFDEVEQHELSYTDAFTAVRRPG